MNIARHEAKWKVTLAIKAATPEQLLSRRAQEALLKKVVQAVRMEVNALGGEVDTIAESNSATDAEIVAVRDVQNALDEIDELPNWSVENIVRTERISP
jgi:Holliday junction resolvase-like predicted endonuclease